MQKYDDVQHGNVKAIMDVRIRLTLVLMQLHHMNTRGPKFAQPIKYTDHADQQLQITKSTHIINYTVTLTTWLRKSQRFSNF